MQAGLRSLAVKPTPAVIRPLLRVDPVHASDGPPALQAKDEGSWQLPAADGQHRVSEDPAALPAATGVAEIVEVPAVAAGHPDFAAALSKIPDSVQQMLQSRLRGEFKYLKKYPRGHFAREGMDMSTPDGGFF